MASRTYARHPSTLPARPVAGLRDRVAAMLSLGRQRDRLRDLPDHLLDDIGVSRRDAEKESARPLWDVPGHWHR